MNKHWIFILLAIFVGVCYLSTPNTASVQKRGIICNLQDYNPETAKHDIDMCRLGLTKETK